jgi:hypothetical protein
MLCVKFPVVIKRVYSPFGNLKREKEEYTQWQ